MNIGYIKRVMQEAGFLETPLPDLEWGAAEERAWQALCIVLGARYTPYPESISQDVDFLAALNTETLSVPKPPPARASGLVDVRDYIPTPPPIPEGMPERLKQKLPTMPRIPASFRMTPVSEDPLAGVQPNIERPTIANSVRRMNPDRARRLNAVRETVEKPGGPIRVR